MIGFWDDAPRIKAGTTLLSETLLPFFIAIEKQSLCQIPAIAAISRNPRFHAVSAIPAEIAAFNLSDTDSAF
jgi:hypothetical protein